jgi:hypothetical protein
MAGPSAGLSHQAGPGGPAGIGETPDPGGRGHRHHAAGRLGPGLFEPANSHFWESVREVEPALFKAFNPWDEITTPEALEELLARAGVAHPTVVAASGQHRLDRPDRFWDIVLGSGYRGTVDALSPEQHDRMRGRLLGELRSRSVTALRTDVVFGTAERPV